MIEINKKAFAEIGEDRWRRACDHVEKTVDQLKATNLYTMKQDERFVSYVMGSDDSGTDS